MYYLLFGLATGNAYFAKNLQILIFFAINWFQIADVGLLIGMSVVAKQF